MGMLFQHGALFSALTVLQNVMAPIKEHFSLTEKQATALGRLKIALANLPPDTADKCPSKLSGGMIKRAALARAMALDPQILFLDEPTSGLDPIAANEFDGLVQRLNRDLGITFVIVTHDLDTLAAICHRVAVLVDGKMVVDTLPNLVVNDHPWIKSYFQGPRARAAFQRREENG
jgi:phospholipid/cholesterol/gamma-HCH transport system ATP-binding protein